MCWLLLAWLSLCGLCDVGRALTTLDAAEASPASVPCHDAARPADGDALMVVLVYRDDDFARPVFTFDNRSPSTARQSLSAALSGRQFFFRSETAHLEIEQVSNTSSRPMKRAALRHFSIGSRAVRPSIGLIWSNTYQKKEKNNKVFYKFIIEACLSHFSTNRSV